MPKYWPMGCKKTKNPEQESRLLMDPHYIAQEKFDGISCIVQVVEDGSLKVTTRGATKADPDTPIDITHRVKGLHGCKFPEKAAGTVFDVEIIHPEMTHEEVAGVLGYRSGVPVPKGMQIKIYDLLSVFPRIGNVPIELTNRTLMSRLDTLYRFRSLEDVSPMLQLAQTTRGYEDKQRLLEGIWNDGGEGIVLKNDESLYYQGKKLANAWYKIKKSDTIDAEIVGALPPSTYYKDRETGVPDLARHTRFFEEGWIGSITYKYEEEGETFFGSTSGITDHMREILSDGHHDIHKKYVGRMIEVGYMQKTKHGNLQHPRFIRFRPEEEKSEL